MTPTAAPLPGWLSDFTVPESFAGVLLALDFGDDGLWAARLDGEATDPSARHVAATVTEPRITPQVLDVRIAGALRDAGVVDGAERPEVFAELVALAARARDRLRDRDSALLMGTEHLRLVTVSLESAMAGTVPELNRAHGMIVELAGAEPVAAVLLGPGTEAWPGLWEGLTARGFSPLLPGDAFPATFAGDDDPTKAMAALPERPAQLAWTQTEPIAEELAPRPNRVLAGVGAVACLAILGGGITVAVLSSDNDEHDSSTISVVSPTGSLETTATTEESAASPTTALPGDIEAARAPLLRYTPPRTTTSQSPTATQAPTGQQPRPRQRPNFRRTIPNPIPGLPPIVIG